MFSWDGNFHALPEKAHHKPSKFFLAQSPVFRPQGLCRHKWCEVAPIAPNRRIAIAAISNRSRISPSNKAVVVKFDTWSAYRAGALAYRTGPNTWALTTGLPVESIVLVRDHLGGYFDPGTLSTLEWHFSDEEFAERSAKSQPNRLSKSAESKAFDIATEIAAISNR